MCRREKQSMTDAAPLSLSLCTHLGPVSVCPEAARADVLFVVEEVRLVEAISAAHIACELHLLDLVSL